MKTLTVRLPESLVAQIETESRERKVSKSEIVRERLSRPTGVRRQRPASLEAIADLIGAVDGLPYNSNMRKKDYLKAVIHERKRAR